MVWHYSYMQIGSAAGVPEGLTAPRGNETQEASGERAPGPSGFTVLDGGAYWLVKDGGRVVGLAMPHARIPLWDVYCNDPERCGLVDEATSLPHSVARIAEHARTSHPTHVLRTRGVTSARAQSLRARCP